MNLNKRVEDYNVDHLLSSLSNQSSWERSGEVTYNGNLRNARLYVKRNSITFKGSVSKFLHGNNVDTFHWREISTFIDEVSNTSGVDFSEAEIKRVDIAMTHATHHPIEVIANQLGDYPRKRKTRFDNSYYWGTKRSAECFLIYDKGKEAKLNLDHNLIRAELRWQTRTQVQKHGILSLNDLKKEEIQNALLNRWKHYLKKIEKTPTPVLDYSQLTTPTKAAKAFLSANRDDYLTFLENAKACKGLTAENYRRAKNSVIPLAAKGEKHNPLDEFLTHALGMSLAA